MSKAKQLYELQEIDLEIERKQSKLETVESQLGDDHVLVEARAALEEQRARLAELEREQRGLEWQVDDLSAKIAKLEEKLYSGSVRNPRELMDMQSDEDHLRARRREQEESLLDAMGRVEDVQKAVNLKASELDTLERGWREEQARLTAEQGQLKTELAALQEQRRIAAAGLDAASLELYQGLRQSKGGRAVAKAEQGRCQGCRIGLPMSDLQRARMGQLVSCSNCGRILYLG